MCEQKLNKNTAKMTTFGELTQQVHLINDLILSDMICEDVDTSEVAGTFTKHLLTTKYWFARISWANKKRYLLALLQDVRSAWTLSLVLKSMWNCRPKDAVMSVSEQALFSGYDQVPMDHNRTALPISTLAQVMKNDRIWFLSLDPESQALVLSELLTVGGGPVMWEVLRRARYLYDKYREQLVQNLQECIVVHDQMRSDKSQHQNIGAEKSTANGVGQAKKDTPKSSVPPSPAPESAGTTPGPVGEAQKALDANLAAWNATIKSMRDSLKLEELEMIFNDGTKRKIWKVNRPKPEAIETVDFVQQLPSFIGKKIMSYLPYNQLNEYAKVNKYWAFLVDEYRAEVNARNKLNADFEKLHDILLRHDTSTEMFVSQEPQFNPQSSQGVLSNVTSVRAKQNNILPSVKASEKSAGAYSLRHFLGEKLTRPVIAQKPLRNLKEMTDRMERRGAADENIWKWCECILAHAKKIKKCKLRAPREEDGVLALGKLHFPCPLMKMSMDVPLIPPLYRDPIMATSAKPRRNISECIFTHVPKTTTKRYSLWTRDLSSLYPVFKIPSYQSPI